MPELNRDRAAVDEGYFRGCTFTMLENIQRQLTENQEAHDECRQERIEAETSLYCRVGELERGKALLYGLVIGVPAVSGFVWWLVSHFQAKGL